MIEDPLPLTYLRDSRHEHSWMWALSPKLEPDMPEEHWLRAMRLRLGCAHICSDMLCASYSERLLDRSMYYA